MLRDDFHVRLGTIDPKTSTAYVDAMWTPEEGYHDIFVTLDPSQGGIIESMLHECLHIVIAEHIGDEFNRTLEEIIIHAVEREVWVKSMKAADTIRWRALINSKLEEAEANAPSTSIRSDDQRDGGSAGR